MADNHRDPPLTTRPPAALKQQATAALQAHDREMQAFVVACLTALVADPKGFLGQLADHWPPEKPRGRPRKTAALPQAPADASAAPGQGTGTR
ncbi:hypothetical protein [Streptomyces melanogenes]|uniref:hypothetical protein n=1 Tax=Streptomyces melanogenes TaxID=67326 RepID=UPI00167EF902|nr:hypothetical protein [Streptomyces melanogenes]GGP80238.1 hypothetical protein GCM10010278_68370 [Streptomyces melanogenes]